MNKIKVITRHSIANYGSILQAKATCEVLSGFGYDAEIIDYIPKEESSTAKRVATFARFGEKRGVKGLIYKFVKFPDELIKGAKFSKFRKKNLRLTKKYHTLQELKAEDFKESYLCAGSDQLWGHMPYADIDPAFFLDFGSDKNKYFAFSASLGRTDFDEEYYKNLNSYLKKFSFITVREQSGAKIINTKTPYKAEHVLDPTLMIEREFWLNFANKKIKQKPYILLYQLRKNKKIDEYVKNLSKKTGLKIVRVSTSVYDYLKFGKKKILKSPEYVLSLFRDAKCVVTDSFHATVFSLVFNTKFIDFLPATTHERITDLLSTVGLTDRIATWTEDDFNVINKEVDWQSVNSILKEFGKKNRQFIKEKLLDLEK